MESNSRQDFYFGNVQPFNQTVFDQTRSFWTDPIVDIQMGANALVARQATSKATNPTFNLSEIGTVFAYAETAAYIIVLGDKVSGTVERDMVEYLFGKSSNSEKKKIRNYFLLLTNVLNRKRAPAVGPWLGYPRKYPHTR